MKGDVAVVVGGWGGGELLYYLGLPTDLFLHPIALRPLPPLERSLPQSRPRRTEKSTDPTSVTAGSSTNR